MPEDVLGLGPIDQVRVYVIHHPNYAEGALTATAITNHLEGLSEVLGTNSIATRVLCEAFDPKDEGGPPQFVDLRASVFSVAILLADMNLTNALKEHWSSVRETLVAALAPESEIPMSGFVIPLVIAVNEQALDPLQTEGAVPLDEGAIQAERAYEWPHPISDPRGVTRILLHTCRLILDGLDATQTEDASGIQPTRRQVFLSHAKSDLQVAEAENRDAIVERLRQRMMNTNYGLEAYFDATHALPGLGWRRQFQRAIASGSLIAVGTDSFASRPICQWELLQAKRVRRPIISINAVREREAASFAYGGNLPSKRVVRFDDAELDRLLLDLVMEMARVELWLREARAVVAQAGVPDAALLPRPAKLVDLAFQVLEHQAEGDTKHRPSILVYPDPPLSDDLYELIEALKPPDFEVLPLSRLQVDL